MSYAKYGLAGNFIGLGKTVLALSALGLFTKLLNIELNQLQILGMVFKQASASLIPGFIGLALMYAFLAFSVARLEGAVEQHANGEAAASTKQIVESKPHIALVLISLPVSVLVYAMPYLLGLFSIILLWVDSMNVLRSLWTLAIQ